MSWTFYAPYFPQYFLFQDLILWLLHAVHLTQRHWTLSRRSLAGWAAPSYFARLRDNFLACTASCRGAFLQDLNRNSVSQSHPPSPRPFSSFVHLDLGFEFPGRRNCAYCPSLSICSHESGKLSLIFAPSSS